MDEPHALLAVQDHDTAIDQLRYRRAHLPERVAATEATQALGAIDADLAGWRERSEAMAPEQRRLEATLADLEAKRAALERKLAATSVPREAEALTAELAVLRERQSEHEDRLLELMEQAEEADAAMEALGARRVPLVARLEEIAPALTAAEATVDAELADHDRARAAAAAALPPPLLARYERLRSRLGGVGVARLEQGRCTGCSLSLSTGEQERIRHEAPGVLVECEHCGRILVA